MHLSRILPLSRPPRCWRVDWDGHDITIESSFVRQRLVVNGVTIRERVPWLSPNALLHRDVRLGERRRSVIARVGTFDDGTLGCHIYISGELIGGDVGREFSLSSQRSKGSREKTVGDRRREARSNLRVSLVCCGLYALQGGFREWPGDFLNILLPLWTSVCVFDLWKFSRDARTIR